MLQTLPDLRERSDLILTLARVLHVNGQSTGETLAACERLGSSLGLRAKIIPAWAQLQLQTGDLETISIVIEAPIALDMHRVALAMHSNDELIEGKLTPSDSLVTINAISKAPPAPTWLFTLASAAGAAALSVIFGVQHSISVVLIAVSAAAGAVMRRTLAHQISNPLPQPFCAALVAGIIGALGVHYQLSSSLRLIAVCPCMILVPGPHILNGMMDLAALRVTLGASRLIYAGLVILAISSGLLVGLSMLNVSLPVDSPSITVPLWLDVIAAGIAVAAFGIFFSMPLRTLVWPVGIGMLAHAIRWLTLAGGAELALGTFIACVIAGLVLTPVARRFHMPFAAVAFAAVVSMMPGAFLFRMVSGFVQLTNSSNPTSDLLSGTIANGIVAINIILAMSFGLLVSKIVVDRISDGRNKTMS